MGQDRRSVIRLQRDLSGRCLLALLAALLATTSISCGSQETPTVVATRHASGPESAATPPAKTSTETADRVAAPNAVSAVVISITDGDTITVRMQGREERVRLIGIDSPETGECLADKSRAALVSLLQGKTVLLERDVSDRDQYGRLLRYVFVGDTLANVSQVRAGLASARRYEPDTGRASELEKAQAVAQSERLGIWSGSACGPASPAVLEISSIQADAPGDDNLNLNGEWVEIRNAGGADVVLTGWVLKDNSATHRFQFPGGFTLTPGARVRVYTGCGTNNATDLFWCNRGSAIWNNGGDTASLLDPTGNIAVSRSY